MNGNRSQSPPRDLGTVLMLAGLGAASGLLSWLLVDFADELKLRFEYEFYGIQLTPVAIYPGEILANRRTPHQGPR